MTVDIKIKTRYNETDQMGVIYHANYFNWFTLGRDAIFDHIEVDYRSLEKDGIYLPVAEVNCKYIKSAYYNDELTIRTSVRSFKGVKLILDYEILRDDECIAKGYTVHGFVDRDMKPVKLRRTHREWDEKLRAASEN
ncbi:MAG: acyl-CoA thioesterase [Tissierellales bacterium]|jgi:acyl-CoA thioester hydrolase|nr:acyl-CoA thioesterase [Tissierellales bacterium]